MGVVGALDQPIATRAQDGVSPVVYRFDLADANTYFLADRFPVKDRDIIFVADAGAAQVQKLFTLLSTVTGPILTGLLVCRDRKSTRLNSSHSQISYAVFCLKKKKSP